jgi:hypothetical protein
MGMPFLQQHEVKLDTANSTAIFGKHHDNTIRCNETQSAAILVTAAAGRNEEQSHITRLYEGIPQRISRKRTATITSLTRRMQP